MIISLTLTSVTPLPLGMIAVGLLTLMSDRKRKVACSSHVTGQQKINHWDALRKTNQWKSFLEYTHKQLVYILSNRRQVSWLHLGWLQIANPIKGTIIQNKKKPNNKVIPIALLVCLSLLLIVTRLVWTVWQHIPWMFIFKILFVFSFLIFRSNCWSYDGDL